jgi:putative transposase
MTTFLVHYAETFELTEPIRQAGYYDFNLFTEEKTEEKLIDMHQNPVRAGLVPRPCDWAWSSARFYEAGRPVGVPIEWLR